LKEIETQIVGILERSKAFTPERGLGFRELHRVLSKNPIEKYRVGSFSTLQKCLQTLMDQGAISRDPKTKKFYFDIAVGHASYDRALVLYKISEANAFGGGNLRFPDIMSILSRKDADLENLPKTKTFWAADIFAKADLNKALESDIGPGYTRSPEFVTIETFDGYWPETKPKDVSLNKKRRSIGREIRFLRKILPHYNARTSLHNFLKMILKDEIVIALTKKIPDTEEISDEIIDDILSKLFKGIETVVFTQFLDVQALGKWLKTSEGKNRLMILMENSGQNAQI